jgi:hypothetical protein
MRPANRRTVLTLAVLAVAAAVAWSMLLLSLPAGPPPTPGGPVYGGTSTLPPP